MNRNLDNTDRFLLINQLLLDYPLQLAHIIPILAVPLQIIDNEDLEFSTVEKWRNFVDQGLDDDDVSWSLGDKVKNQATWDFNRLAPRTAQIAVTWSEKANLVANALYTIEGESIPLTVEINQEQAPHDFLDPSKIWENRRTVTINDNTITVPLSNNANENVIANAIGIVPVQLQIIDDGDSEFRTVGNWTNFEGQGFQNDVLYSPPGSGNNKAIWEFNGLVPGIYQIAATWTENVNRATNASYTIEGGAIPLTVEINQEQAPNDFSDPSGTWENLGTITITGNTITVSLSDDANDYVIADATRVMSVNVPQLISIEQPDDVSLLRSEFISLLFGQSELPSLLPSQVISNFSDTRYDDIFSLSRIDKLKIVMEYEIESNIYHFIPKTPNNNVVLYHQGHGGDFYLGKEKIKNLLDHGYSVVGLSMPLTDFNNQPIVQLPGQGQLKLTSHNQMGLLSPEYGHPVKYFLEPVVGALNYLENHYDYPSFSMMGLSGGGWTTTLAAAIDTRIDKSFPVAGSYPLYLRDETDWGDYEQHVREIYNTANYLELYILGSYGVNRKQLQITNQYDPCCFSGTRWESYKDIVRERVNQLGSGEYDLFMDSTSRNHMISPTAMDRILTELNPSIIQIIDNGDSGFSTVGNWTHFRGQGFDDDVDYRDPGNGSNQAIWNFSGLVPGIYQIAATWTENINRATNAPYTIEGGVIPLEVEINQEQAPNDFSDQWGTW
ncbi:MAG TPA: hypothetical protein DCF68_08675, partial [Cyanothece sp. UBA12306]|nr:hypothetical protein [Cyanothece sp. UBA12306]